jgi:basic membrane protein A
MQRRLLRVSGALLIAGLLAGCSSTKTKTSSSPTTGGTTASSAAAKAVKVGLVYDLTGRGDKSFNDSAATGLEKAKSQLAGVDTKELTPNSDGSNREQLLRQLADLGYNPIIAVGFLFADSIKKVAADSPNTKFGVVDTTVDLPNVTGLTFTEEQGSYLVGAAAALKSKSGHIGFVGGVDQALIQKFDAGYSAGAKAVNPTVKIDKKYLTEPPDFSGFKDPAKGKEAAKAMYAGGADVVYQAAGLSGTGVFSAAQEASSGGQKVWAIGVDSDQYQAVDASIQPLILTSMVKHVDVAVFNFIKAFQDGTVKSGPQSFNLKSDGVGYATSGGFVDDIKPKLETYKQQIIAGQIVVPTTP